MEYLLLSYYIISIKLAIFMSNTENYILWKTIKVFLFLKDCLLAYAIISKFLIVILS